MPRERKDFKRKSGLRDARLFVIATEGEITEQTYFRTLVSPEHYHSSRVHVEVLASQGGRSAPRYVIESLDDFRKEYRIREDDELWVVIDRDFRSWTEKELSEAFRLARQKGYELALSNPCFELWLLLHLIEVHSLPEADKENIRLNRKTGTRTHCDRLIVRELGAYNKKKPEFGPFMPKVRKAIIHANKLIPDADNADLINELGTRLHVLVERII